MKPLLLALAFAALPIRAAAPELIDPRPAGDLKAYIAVSDSPRYITEWVRTRSDKPVGIRRTLEYRTGQIAHIAVIVTGFEGNAGRRLDLVADILILKPDGSVMFDLKEYAKLRVPFPPEPAHVMLDPALDLGFDETDKPGTYILRATVRDRVASKAATAEERLTLLGSPTEARNILERAVDNPAVLDELWGHYFSTRDPEAIRRIISVVHLEEEGSGMDLILGAAAAWSLMSNAYQHPDVYRICKGSLASSSGATRRALQKVLDRVDKKKAAEAE